MKRFFTLGLTALVLSAVPRPTVGAPVTNHTVAAGSWSTPANWSLSRVPELGDDVIIGHSLLLSSPTPSLRSCTVGAATLTFTNWNTTLTAVDITVQTGGTINHVVCNTNANILNTNRVYLICSNLTVYAGGKIDADWRGHRGCTNHPANLNFWGDGPGASKGSCGAGYGGRGAYGAYGNVRGPTYGSSNAPVQPGSGGGAHNSGDGQPGGGAIRIDASGDVTVNGTVSANGHIYYSQSGAGSGGAVYINCATFTGSGILRANGGNSVLSQYSGCAGGGGRIAVYYSMVDSFSGTRTATAGTGYNVGDDAADDGTIHVVYTGTDVLFTVEGEPTTYGTSVPYGYGIRPLAHGTIVTNEIEQYIAGPAGTRRECTGWNVSTSGVGVLSGSTTQALFQLPVNHTLFTWYWTNQHSLAVAAGPGGTASVGQSGWYTNGVTVTPISATATGLFEFLQWTGDVPVGDETNNPLSLVMDQPRSVQAAFVSVVPETRVWHGTGNWASTTNWTPEGIPSDQDTIIVASGSLLYDVPLTCVQLTVSNGASLIMSGWQTAITVHGDVQVGGTLTHALTDVITDPSITNRVLMYCSNLVVEAGASINVDQKGYRGAIAIGNNNALWGQGPGAGINAYAGSHGGLGGVGGYGGSTKGTYGSITEPSLPGSSAGTHNADNGGSGGGAVWIEATNTVTVNGTITANGQTYIGQSSAGAGGSIYIRCHVFAATGAVVRANGGAYGTSTYSGGGGGGGRIAIHYDPSAQAAANLIAKPTVTLSANSGWGSKGWGEPGTVYLTDASFFPGDNTVLKGGQFLMPGFTAWSPASLSYDDGLAIFPEGFDLTVTGDLTTSGDGGLQTSGGAIDVRGEATFGATTYGRSLIYAGASSSFSVTGTVTVSQGMLSLYSSGANLMTATFGSNCVLTGGGDLLVQAGIAAGYPNEFGATINVEGDLTLASGSAIYPYSHSTNGASPILFAQNVTIAAGGSIDADAKGFAGGLRSGNTWGYGPGRGYDQGGGGYAGQGGVGAYGGTRGTTYGDPEEPLEPGSGGGSHNSALSGRGGGLVRVVAAGTLDLDGTITAVGQNPNTQGASGAGGGIYLTCNIFEGAATGLLRADGGAAKVGSVYNGGAGGGGRIAVYRNRHRYLGTTSVAGGIGHDANHNGTDGSLTWLDPPRGIIILFR